MGFGLSEQQKNRLVIVGASVRPWVQSAALAGMHVDAFDFFADWDCQQLFTARQLAANSGGSGLGNSINRIAWFQDLLESSNQSIIDRCGAAVILGGFETRIEQVQRLANQMVVLGTSPFHLSRLQNQLRVFSFLQRSGFAVPPTRQSLERHHLPDRWLRKTFGGSGGLGVRLAKASDVDIVEPDVCFQSRVDGANLSAVFVSTCEDNCTRTTLLGITQQMVGDDQMGADEFQYCGSLGPVRGSKETRQVILSLGNCLAKEFGIVGLWGTDFIATEQSVVPVDINPRPTASMELFESLLRREAPIQSCDSVIRSMLDLHVRACRGQLSREQFERLDSISPGAGELMEGKAILFRRAKQPLRITDHLFGQLKTMFNVEFFGSTHEGASIADVPNPGQLIRVGHPIMTLRVRTQRDQVLIKLREQAELVLGLFEVG